MTQAKHIQSGHPGFNERLADLFLRNGRYSPRFLFTGGVGVVVIYFLSLYRILGSPEEQLLWLGVVLIALAALQLLVTLPLARRKRGLAAYVLSTLFILAASVLFVLLWQGIYPLAFLVALVAPLTALLSGLPRRVLPWFIALTVFTGGAVLFAESFAATSPTLARMSFGASGAIASLAFLVATGLLLIVITFVTQNRNYPSLQRLLLTSFIVIVTIPTVMVTVLSGVGAYGNSQAQTFNTLKAIASLKENQISLLVDEVRTDADKIQSDSVFKKNILSVVAPGNISPDQKTLNLALARTFLISLQKDRNKYTEIMVLDTQGSVVLSTTAGNEGRNYGSQLFFRQGTVKTFTGFADAPDFGAQNLVLATPLFDTNGKIIRGVIALRSDASAVKTIMENTPGFAEAETYLVDKDFRPVTQTRTPAETIRSEGALRAILDNLDGQAVYNNYAGRNVLGYYQWYEPMQMAVIAEAPVSFVIANSVRSLAGSSLLALFVIGIAIATVAISAKSIADPIKDLARITESFTAGKYFVRANVDRRDEIGALGNSFDQMAAQLQDIIGRLEQRVADRTMELESQTMRVRVAAEIARDAALAPELGELLERSVKLIRERFNYYHTGLFLLDKAREFATLAASPTEAGMEMIESGYKTRVGEMNIVGRVALSGEPRLLNDAEFDPLFAANVLLPDTRAELALPLRVGNTVIGVLDIHSDKPRAFGQDDIAIMQVMADQIATAIERARLLEEVERNLKELETAYGRYTREGWQRLTTGGGLVNRGYRFNNIRIEPIKEAPRPEAEAGGKLPSAARIVSIPIKLRGQQIGTVSARLKEGYNSRTISTLEAATERLAAALESARLYEEARSRADREQSISRVTSAISSSTEYEEILRTTVREIGRLLNDTEVAIQITGDMDEAK